MNSPAARIVLLSPLVIDQIAAGEVVERPASVVKELVDNSLDAGATRIDVELDEGGLARISVRDNGRGIHPEDLLLAVTRHATSKLRDATELADIRTLGFRGEALASVAAVARVDIRSRTAAAAVGTHLHTIPGEPPVLTPAGMPVGTQVEVHALFANVPARRKFMRAEATEVGQCSETLLRLAIVQPDVHFTLRHGKRELLNLPRATLAGRVAQVLERRVAGPFFAFSGTDDGVEVHAFLPHPSAVARGRGSPYLITRRRVVRERALGQILAQAYGLGGEAPTACLFVEPPPAAVDVNVHPQKAEVRFSDPQQIYAAVRRVLTAAMAAAPWAGELPHPIVAGPTGHAPASVPVSFTSAPARPRDAADAAARRPDLADPTDPARRATDLRPPDLADSDDPAIRRADLDDSHDLADPDDPTDPATRRPDLADAQPTDPAARRSAPAARRPDLADPDAPTRPDLAARPDPTDPRGAPTDRPDLPQSAAARRAERMATAAAAERRAAADAWIARAEAALDGSAPRDDLSPEPGVPDAPDASPRPAGSAPGDMSSRPAAAGDPPADDLSSGPPPIWDLDLAPPPEPAAWLARAGAELPAGADARAAADQARAAAWLERAGAELPADIAAGEAPLLRWSERQADPPARTGPEGPAPEARPAQGYRLSTRALDRDYADHKRSVMDAAAALRPADAPAPAAGAPAPATPPPALAGLRPGDVPEPRDMREASGPIGQPGRPDPPALLACLPGPVALFADRDALLAVDLRRIRSHLVYLRLQRDLIGRRAVAVQGLLTPAVVRRSEADVALLTGAQAELLTLGVDLDAFGDDAVVVRGVPAHLRHCVDDADASDLVARIVPWLRIRASDGDRAARERGLLDAIATTRGGDPAPRLARRWLAELLDAGAALESVPGIRRWSATALLGAP